MSVKVALEHRTTYEFAHPVTVAPHVVRLRPAPHCRTPIEAYSLEVVAEEPLPQLAAGPVRQLAGPAGLPREDRQARDHRRPGRRPDGDQPVRLLRRGVRRAVPVRLRADAGGRPRAVPPPGRRQRRRRAAGAQALPPLPADGIVTVDFLAGLNAAVNRDVAYDVRMEPGVQTPDETLRPPDRLVPRQRVAAGQPAAPVRPGRPVRLRLPGPAGRRPLRRRAPRRPERAEPGLHRPARLGRGLRPGRRLGRHGPDQQPVRRRGPHPAQRHARTRAARRRSRAPPTRSR